MAITALTPRIARPDVWHGRYGPALALALVALPFAAAILWATTLPSVDQATVAANIRETAALVDEHAAAMERVGERLATSAAASTVPDRAVWVAYGQHMAADGRNLAALGDRLRSTATVADADQAHRGSISVGVAVLRARWEQLRADGRVTAEHGRVMVQMAADVDASVAAGILTREDASRIREASAGMAEAGERIVQLADLLIASVSQMQRWMGWGR